MTDATDDLEFAGLVASTYCQRHKAGRGLWPHECPDCQQEMNKRRVEKSIRDIGIQTRYSPTHWMDLKG